MSVLYAIDKATLDGIGNAIREKKGTTEPIPVTSLADEIASIEGASTSNTVGGNNYFSLVDMFYGHTGDYTLPWGTQALNGELYLYDHYTTKWSKQSFTSLATYQYEVAFLKDGISIYTFSPSYEECYIVLSGEQTVSPSFKEWFGGAWIATDESNIPSTDDTTEVITELLLSTGTYTSNGSSYPPSYSKFPRTYDITVPFNAQLIDSGDNNPRNIVELRIQGANGEGGPPYPTFTFTEDSGMPWNYYGYELSSGKVTLTLTLENTVPVVVYTNITSMFNYQN